MRLDHPLLGRDAPCRTPLRVGGATGHVGAFGMTRLDADGKPKMHKGVDLLALPGWPVFAAHTGTVARAGWENDANHAQGYGLRIWIEGDGGTRTVYAHLSELKVAQRQGVQAGDLIGYTGRTGNVGDAPTHLHFEVHLGGGPVDPAPLLEA